MTYDLAKARPLHNWVLCRNIRPSTTRTGGLHMPKNFDKNVKTEGVAEVIAVGQGKWLDDVGDFVDHGLRPGDKVLYRGFLRYAHQLGDLFGEERSTDVFAISAYDLLAKVVGHGTLGANDEYQL